MPQSGAYQRPEKKREEHLITTLRGAKYRVLFCQIGVARWFRCTLAPPNKVRGHG